MFPQPSDPGSAVSPPPPRRWGRRRALALTAVLALVAFAGGWYRYHITRPEYRSARGEEAVRARDWESVEDYASRLDRSGQPARAHLLRGQSLFARKLPAYALGELNRIADGDPVYIKAVVLSGKCLIDLGQYRKAEQAFSFALSQNADDIDAHRGMAAVAWEMGQLGRAVGHSEEVARLDPTDARPHRLIGLIDKDMAQYEHAAGAYREALRRGLPEPVAGEVHLELAEVLVRLSRYTEALEVVDAGRVGGTPGAALRAEALRGLGRAAEATEVLDAALATSRDAALCALRGELHIAAGQYPEAVDLLEEATRLAPTDYRSHYQLALAYNGVGRKEDATRATAESEKIKQDLDLMTALSGLAIERPWDAGVRRQLAALAARLGNHQLAEVWRKAADACQGSP